jgi:hypothetical protein
MLNYIGMRLVPPPTNPVNPPSDFIDEGNIGNISYAGILQVRYHVSDCTIIFFNPYTGLLRIRVAMNRGNEYKSDLVVKILNNYYAIDDFQGGFYHWALNGPWQTYFKIDPKITLPADAWETNSSVMSGDHSKDSTGLRYVWNIIKTPRHDFFQYARDVGIVRDDGVLLLDPDTGTAPKSDYTDDDLILHVRDHGDHQWNTPTIMLDKKYIDYIQLLYIIYITKNLKSSNNINYLPSNKEVA